MNLIEQLKIITEKEGSYSKEEWERYRVAVRLANKVLGFISDLEKNGVSRDIIDKASDVYKEIKEKQTRIDESYIRKATDSLFKISIKD